MQEMVFAHRLIYSKWLALYASHSRVYIKFTLPPSILPFFSFFFLLFYLMWNDRFNMLGARKGELESKAMRFVFVLHQKSLQGREWDLHPDDSYQQISIACTPLWTWLTSNLVPKSTTHPSTLIRQLLERLIWRLKVVIYLFKESQLICLTLAAWMK